MQAEAQEGANPAASPFCPDFYFNNLLERPRRRHLTFTLNPASSMKHTLKNALLSLLVLGPIAASPAMAQNADLTVIHGIDGSDLALDPALPVDVEVDGNVLLAGFTFGEITDPLSLAPASYQIEISLADPVSPGSNPTLIDVTIDLAAEENATVIAHLAEDFAPTASKFTNDLSPVQGLNTRVILHHTAAAPAVDITLQRRDFFYTPRFTVDGATNGAQASLDLPFGLYAMTINPAGSSRVAFGPAYLVLRPGTITAGYVVGSPNGTAQVFTLPLQG